MFPSEIGKIANKLLLSTVHTPHCNECNQPVKKIGVLINQEGLTYMVFHHGKVQQAPLPFDLLRKAAAAGEKLKIENVFVPGEQLKIVDESEITKLLIPPKHLQPPKQKRRRQLRGGSTSKFKAKRNTKRQKALTY